MNIQDIDKIDQEFDEKFGAFGTKQWADGTPDQFKCFLHTQIKEAEERERERISKLFENNDLYLFPVGLPRVEGVDEQGIRYKGLAIDPDQLLLPTNKKK